MRANVKWSGWIAALVIANLALGPAVSWAGQRRGSGGAGGRSGGGGGVSQPRGGSGGGGGAAVPRDSGGARSGGEPSRGGGRATPPSDGGRQDGGEVRSGTRSRDGGDGVVGRAVPRRNGGYPGGGTTVVVPGYGFWPWGYGGLGFGGFYGSYWDPYFMGGPGYYGGGWGGYPDGALRLKVKPRDASVFVDGFYAGQVDQFDGVFQRLRLDPGPHRIEVSAEGYETLTFEIRVLPDRTTTYKGELARVP